MRLATAADRARMTPPHAAGAALDQTLPPIERPIASGPGCVGTAAVRSTGAGPVVWIRIAGGEDRLLEPATATTLRRGIAEAARSGIPAVLDMTGCGGVAGGVVGQHAWGGAARAVTAASGVVPLVGLVDGDVASGFALLLGLVDVVVVTAGSTVHVSGPAAVAATTGRATTSGELGGAAVHAAVSGVAHLVATDRLDAVQRIDELLALLPPNNADPPPVGATADPPDRACPELRRIVPTDARLGYDVREVARTLLDDHELLELHARFGRALVCGLGRLGGRTVGVVANQPSHQAGAIDVEASQKGARFVQWCDAFGIPLLTLVDTPGYLPGRDLEWSGMIRHGGQLAMAYAGATVPRMSVVLRKAYGGAYIVMDSRTLGSDLCLAWPGAEIAVMGAAGAVEVLDGRRLATLPPADAAAARADAEAAYDAEHLRPEPAVVAGVVDAVIDPDATRAVLALALGSLLGKRSADPRRKHANGPL